MLQYLFDCLKCGRKLKTLHKRVYNFDKAHYEPRGYHCETCRIYYDAKSKQASKAVYGVAPKNELVAQSAIDNAYENDRIRSLHETHANAAQNECETMNAPILSAKDQVHEISGPRGTRTLDQLLRRQPFYPS